MMNIIFVITFFAKFLARNSQTNYEKLQLFNWRKK
tara:strand:+ start:960 stop:1064 length:105 start_codon:yes stop_codon:yes gene_type:complete